MKSIIAIESMLQEFELRISTAKSQLKRHESGDEKLSLLAQSSVENSLEKHTLLVDKYKQIIDILYKTEKSDSYEHQRLRSAVQRKKYYKYAREQNGKIKYKENDEKIEAAMIIDELPEETIFEERELFEMSFKNIEKYLDLPTSAQADLKNIQNEFRGLVQGFTEENIRSLELLNYLIPILIFYFYVFILSIEDYKKNHLFEDTTDMKFFPNYQDWWIIGLWSDSSAYFSLYKWKKTIKDSCYTNEQKHAWEVIFNNWVFVKSLLSQKSKVAFEYHYIFDSLLFKYTKLDSEFESINHDIQKQEIQEFIKNEDLFAFAKNHNVITPYIRYKMSD